MKTLRGLLVVLSLVLANGAFADTNRTAKSSSELDVTIQAQLDGRVIVGFEKLADETVKIHIYDKRGELIYAEKVKNDTRILKRYDLSNLPAGNYAYVVSNDLYSVRKVIEKK